MHCQYYVDLHPFYINIPQGPHTQNFLIYVDLTAKKFNFRKLCVSATVIAILKKIEFDLRSP